MKYVSNAFSLQMLAFGATLQVEVLNERPNLDEAVSYVGHQDLANLLGLPFNRGNLLLQPGDVLYVAQYVGGRLPEGATSLPDGAKIVWYSVRVL